MFSKANKSSSKPAGDAAASVAADAGSARRAPKAASLVSEDITIEGAINGEGELHVDGVVRGDIHVAKLTIGETGHIEGGVHAESVEVRGRVIGSITAKLVRLCPTAYVDGDVTHEQLSIEAGAFFQGRSLKFQRPPAQAPAALSAPDSAPALTAQSA